ncbi:MAG: ATP-dependent nuclease subunit B, partial [Clostridiales bacterium]|nr:ATP-dependent nuclease subunit B [Clostridiales bacterium]
MMELLMGRAGSGKTTAILRRIASRESSGKRQILIVPELASHEYERMLAEQTGNTGSRFAEVLTFRRIANRVFSEAGGLADTVLTPAGRLLVLYEAARRASDALTVYGGATRKPDILRDLLRVLDEMKCSCVSAEDMLRAAEEAEGHLSDKLRDLG